MPRELSKRPTRLFMEDILVDAWTPDKVRGYDVKAAPGTDAHLPLAQSIDDVGAHYPSLIVSPSQPGVTTGQTTYDFLSSSGPGQNRNGTMVATVRAADDRDYVGDPATETATDAMEIADEILVHVENIVQDNPLGGTTSFSFLGSSRPADVPDDTEAEPTVRLAQATIHFGWLRTPS